MSSLPIFRSLQALHDHLKHFLLHNPKAAQLDGNLRQHPEDSRPAVYVWIESQQAWYVLNGNTKRHALQRFVEAFEAAADKKAVLVPSRPDKPKPSMIIAGGTRASGWYCFHAERLPHECEQFLREWRQQTEARQAA